MTSLRRCVVLLPAIALLAACGSASDNGEAAKSADQIVNDAANALRSAHSVHLDVHQSGGSGSFSGSLDILAPGGATGSFTSNGSVVQFIVAGGKVYLKGKDFFAKVIGPQAGTIIGDRWVVAPAGADLSSFTDLADLSKLATCVVQNHGTLTKGGTTTVNGQAAVLVNDKGDKPGTQPAKLYVATTGTAYPLQLQATAPGTMGKGPSTSTCGSNDVTSTGTATFSKWGESVTVKAPSDALDLSQLGG